jgi:lysozyme family protein
VEDLSHGERVRFYQDEFWSRPKIEQLPEGVADVVFNQAVQSGAGTAVKELQSYLGATPDGVIGPKTLAALTSAVEKNGKEKVIADLLDNQQNFLQSLILKDPSKEGNAEGWNNRINKLRSLFNSPGRA